ncbi:MAG: GIY-YIG nuclease family protein [Gammaproteobacteria bacterium]|nr:GIY-YIG nuclease family protein [Gammaproteobacteria bacterium]
MSKQGYVYILASKYHGVLYVGATTDLMKRIYQHKQGQVEGFTKQYAVKKLVYFEVHEGFQGAFLRERQIKTWLRQWKINLIEKVNPNWDDLYYKISN